MQLSTFGLGKLFVQVYSSSMIGLNYDVSLVYGGKGMHQIWPLSEEVILWPGTREITGKEAFSLANAALTIEHFIQK